MIFSSKKHTVFIWLFILTMAISYFSLFLLMFYLPFAEQRKEIVPSTSTMQQTDSYLQNWNISTSTQENYYASSDHSSFGEGFRYSVLSGLIVQSNPTRDKRGNYLTKTVGSGSDMNVVWFLCDVWDALEVPEEERCQISQCNWTLFRTSNGNKLLIASLKNSNTIYIAEQIL